MNLLRTSGCTPLLPRLCLVACLLGLTAACATKKEVVTARSDLEAVRGDLRELVDSIDRRQASLGEDLVRLKREMATLEARDEEFRQSVVALQQKMNVARIETDENFRHLGDLGREHQRTLEANLARTVGSLEQKLKGLETGQSDLRQRLDGLTAVTEDQNRRIGQAADRLDVSIDTINEELSRLKKLLADLFEKYNQMADAVNTLHKEVAGRRQEQRTAAPGASVHVVREGESIFSIAGKYGVTADVLIRINNLANPDSLRVGQRLSLP